MSLLPRAFVPLWGRGNKIFWKPGGDFPQDFRIFESFSLHWLYLNISSENNKFSFSMKNQVTKSFSFQKEIVNLKRIWKSNEKPLSKHFSFFKKVVFWKKSKKKIWFATENPQGTYEKRKAIEKIIWNFMKNAIIINL